MAFPAFLDANVLVPINLTDVLLRLAAAKTYRPLWPAHVLDEVERTLLKLDVAAAKVSYRLGVMRERFADAEVTGYEALIPEMGCDEKDRHVLAAAVRARAEVIVTFNTRDFPSDALAPYDITLVHPDDFLLDQLDLYPVQTVVCLRELVAARKNPPETLDVFLTQLEKTTPKFSVQARTTSWQC